MRGDNQTCLGKLVCLFQIASQERFLDPGA